MAKVGKWKRCHSIVSRVNSVVGRRAVIDILNGKAKVDSTRRSVEHSLRAGRTSIPIFHYRAFVRANTKTVAGDCQAIVWTSIDISSGSKQTREPAANASAFFSKFAVRFFSSLFSK